MGSAIGKVFDAGTYGKNNGHYRMIILVQEIKFRMENWHKDNVQRD